MIQPAGSPSPVDDDDHFAFAAEEPPTDAHPASRRQVFRVLSVDDDAAFQHSLRYALASFRYRDQPIEFLTAGSANEAASLLAARHDIAVVLLDVVMESDDAGLRLVTSIRELLGNAEIRIILLTGQPGVAPMQTSLTRLDINDYWLKTDLTRERLHGILTGALRAWEQIDALNRARRGLQMIVEASNSLTSSRTLHDFSGRVVKELARLLRLAPEGLVCVQDGPGSDPQSATIVGAAGRFSHLVAGQLSVLDDTRIRELLRQALAEQQSLADAESQVLYFPGSGDGPRAATYVATLRALDDTELELLRVFASNINSGLINVSLVSQLDRMAYEDSLLAMPNANALLRCLDSVLARPAPRDRALLFIDLDQYSESCLSLGIEQGDLLLARMAARLRRSFPPPALVARLHDDTFAVLGPPAALDLARLDRLEAGDVDDNELAPFISLGAARIDLDHYQGSAKSAMATGSLLLKQSRRQGPGRVVEYEPGMETPHNLRFQLARELHHALRGREIGIALQAQYDLASGTVVGAEALARWTRADGTPIPPTTFIPLAEANGLIAPLGKHIIELTCEALARLAAAGFGHLPIAVNVSALQLAQTGLLDELRATLEAHGLDPHILEIEVTESIAMDERYATGNMLGRLCEAGFPIAIDDFGTGYSSLAYLRTLPAHTLKIDRSFVQEIGVTPERQTIADMIIGLGRRLDMRVIAEGVENSAQADWLKTRGCHHAQGYLFARPEPVAGLIARLQSGPALQ
ncbi:EAL domain-containing protein [Azoarcus olearius]|uniref:Conserved hypothetical signaling protein n=1 Tax=Azoarcus sp. (strain BH72) TaxID=418699 RepID=A1KBS5_AZOSB|nr:EAL domain-containing protein [Azoarcus olearius]CAL96281.1 conserved hypothetical signaling protein [Azoarcus olearius]